MPLAEPLVPRSVRHGGLLLVIAVLQLLVAALIIQIAYPGYSWTHNYISDLGNTHLSPWWPLFTVSSALLGALVVAAAILIRPAFSPGLARSFGLGLLVVAGIGTLSVGLNPEDLRARIHALSAAVAFLGGNTALILLAAAMVGAHHWSRGYRLFSEILGVVGLVAFVLLITGLVGPLGHGGMERLVAGPVLLWGLVVGIHLMRLPTVAPAPPPGAPD